MRGKTRGEDGQETVTLWASNLSHKFELFFFGQKNVESASLSASGHGVAATVFEVGGLVAGDEFDYAGPHPAWGVEIL
jgi:hypothetical protein